MSFDCSQMMQMGENEAENTKQGRAEKHRCKQRYKVASRALFRTDSPWDLLSWHRFRVSLSSAVFLAGSPNDLREALNAK